MYKLPHRSGIFSLRTIIFCAIFCLPITAVRAADIADFVEWTGQAESDGMSTVATGDVNGDGYDDVLVASQAASGGAGVVYLLYGGASALDASDLSNAVQFTGEAAEDYAGSHLATGDVNGDGYADILISALYEDAGGISAGAVYLIYGQSPVLTDVSLSSAIKFTGAAAGDYAGGSISAAGDINNDGYDDILIGAQTNDSAASNAGALYVLYGQASALSSGSLSDAITFTGEVSGDYAGYTSAIVGDVNGDNYDDVLVGAPYNDEAGGSAGKVYLLYGQGAHFANASLSTAVQFFGATAGDQLGSGMSGAGNVNADGYSDFLVGASGVDGYNGAVYVLYGQEADFTSGTISGTELTGEENYDLAGQFMSAAGDVDGDGYDDILLAADAGHSGSATDIGKAFVVFGQAGDLASGILSTSNTDIRSERFIGEAAFDTTGSSVAAGDTNGDGLSDILVGASDNNDGGANAGAAYIGYLYFDGDHDGTTGVGLLDAGSDCNDSDATVATDQTYYLDSDGDGYGDADFPTTLCSGVAPDGYVANNDDTNDNDEDNDGVETEDDCNDQDGSVSVDQTYYVDSDGDGLGDSAASADLCFATAPDGYSDVATDTNDAIPNAGVEIGGDGVDNDGDSAVDEVNTVAENGEHPYYSTLDEADATIFASAIIDVQGASQGNITVTYADNSVYQFPVFTKFHGDKLTLVKSWKNTGYLTVLHPKGKKLKLVNVYTGDVFDSVRLSKNKGYAKNSLKHLDVRHDGSIEVVVTSKKKKNVRLSVVKVNMAKEQLTKKDSVIMQNKHVIPKKTQAKKKRLLLRHSSSQVIERYRVTKAYRLIVE